MGRERSRTTASTAVVRVKWLSRTAGFANDSVETITQKACKHFRLGTTIRAPELVLLGRLDGEELEVTDDILELFPKGTTLTLSRVQEEPLPLAKRAKRKEVEGRLCPDVQPENQPSSSGTSSHVQKPAGMFVWVRYERKNFLVKCNYSDTAGELKVKMEQQTGIRCSDQQLVFNGFCLGELCMLYVHDITRESVLDLAPIQVGGKPVVYLFPPSLIPDARVSVSLVPQWSFSHVYPLAAPKQLENGRERVRWSVSAQPDGTLVEKDTNLELSYLFWEAESNVSLPPSPTLIATDSSTEHFDPAYPVLDCDTPTVVLLPFAELLPYLDAALKSLSLHTSARNDFITYWLPKLSKGPFVALRFLPQAVYERAAELDVQPAPDVVTRVFMLFRGVSAEDAEAPTWTAARACVGEVDWVKVVGAKAEAWDESRFRVLEWGAMEVI